MARDVPKYAVLYFFDTETGVLYGTGGAGDSEDYALPEGMTDIAPPIIADNEKAIFDVELQTWSIEWINPYDGLTQIEKDAWDAEVAKQAEINTAQQKVINRLAEAVDGIYKVMLREGATLNLTTNEITFGDEVRADYDDWVSKRDA